MTTCFGTLRHDEIDSKRLQMFRFRDARCAATHAYAARVHRCYTGRRDLAQVKREYGGRNRFYGVELRSLVRRKRRTHGLGRLESAGFVIRGDRMECRSLRAFLDCAAVVGYEEVDAERRTRE